MRDLVAAADQQPPDDLAAWAAGYLAGHDQGQLLAAHRARQELAEETARLDETSWLPPARETRAERIRREVADGARHARTVQHTSDWPAVAAPGGDAR